MTMDPGAFDLLKAVGIGPESAKQLKICLNGFPKTLSNPGRRVAALCRDGA
jgi:hypothetical protein